MRAMMMAAALIAMTGPAVAEDLCSALGSAVYDVGVAEGYVEEAVGAVSVLQGRLERAPDLFGEDAAALTEPEEGVREARRQLRAALQTMRDWHQQRCPNVPPPR